MLAAERRARRGDGVLREGAEPLMDDDILKAGQQANELAPRAWLAAVPLVVLIATVVSFLVSTGLQAAIADPAGYATAIERGATSWLGFILSNAASYDALVYGAAAGCSVAVVASVGSGALTLTSSVQAFVRGLQAMLLAIVVLCLAWSIGQVMDDLHAGPYVAQLIGNTVPPWSLGTLAFLLAAVMAFATGTSWGTIAILFPIVIPVVALHGAAPGFEAILLGTSSANPCRGCLRRSLLADLRHDRLVIDRERRRPPRPHAHPSAVRTVMRRRRHPVRLSAVRTRRTRLGPDRDRSRGLGDLFTHGWKARRRTLTKAGR